MARRKEFDQDEVLDKAMELFQRRGFEATSMQELVEHMGISRGSLYETFDSKQKLFEAALARYRANAITGMIGRIQNADDPITAIKAHFEGMIQYAALNKTRCGCLMVNSAVEVAPHNPLVSAVLADGFARFEQAFEAALVRARDRGELADGKNPRALARFLVNAMHGLSVASKCEPDLDRMRDIVDVTLAALD